MKLKIAFLSLAGLLATSLTLTAQNNAPPPSAAPTNAVPVTPAAPPTAATVPPAPAPLNEPPISVAPSESATPTSPAETAATPMINPNTVPPSLKQIIPSVIIEDAPLTDAIKNLARQAGINYILDPSLTIGGVGPGGQPNPQPIVSLRWENVTADQALNALLNNYGLALLSDPRTGIARVSKKDVAAPEPLMTKIIQLKYAYATNLMLSAQAVLRDARSRVIADARTSQLVVLATENELKVLDDLILRLDVATKQVLIEARIIETIKNPVSAKGIDWTGTLGGQRISFGNGNSAATTTSTGNSTAGNTTGYTYGSGSAPVGSTSAPFISSPATAGNGTGATAGTTGLNSVVSQVVSTAGGSPGAPGGLSLNTASGLSPATAFLNADGVSAVLSFLNSDTESQTLSTPRAVTLDNEEATLSVITALPIFQISPSTANTPGSAQIIYTNVGTILKVLPRISGNNTIALKVTPEVSGKEGQDSQTVNGTIYTADIFTVRRVTTQVLIPSGNTLVMGGLVLDNPTKTSTKVPVLGDIPFLGAAFHSETKSANKDNLLLFITPTIVGTEDFQPTKSNFLKTKMKIPAVADFNGVMDSAHRKDWSKLGKTDTNNIMGDTGEH